MNYFKTTLCVITVFLTFSSFAQTVFEHDFAGGFGTQPTSVTVIPPDCREPITVSLHTSAAQNLQPTPRGYTGLLTPVTTNSADPGVIEVT